MKFVNNDVSRRLMLFLVVENSGFLGSLFSTFSSAGTFSRIVVGHQGQIGLLSIIKSGRRGGLMVSALVSGSSGPGSSPAWGHCVVFLGKTLYSNGEFNVGG